MTTESFRKDVSKKLSDLAENEDEEANVAWPASLTSSDRKYVHQVASSFGLFTLSEGAGVARFIKVYRKDPGGIDPARRRAFIKNKADQKHAVVEINEEHLPSLRKAADLAPKTSDAEILDLQPKVQPAQRDDRPMDHLPMNVEAVDSKADERKNADFQNETMDKHRRELPSWEKRAEILEAVANNRVVLISGETGCGKSTQVPQFLLDANDKCRLLVAQPRRLAAVSLCQRVVQERGDVHDAGYIVPMERCREKSRLLFCTASVLRRRLYDDAELEGVTHVIFDEVHERDKIVDFALIFLRDLVRRRPDLRLILMSATLQMDTFVEYFGDDSKRVHIPGRMYPAQSLYLDQIVATLWKTPPFRKWMGPGILSAGLEMEEKDWKKQVFHNTNHSDGLWGLSSHIKPYLEGQLTKQKLADGLRRHDVLQQSGLQHDFLIIEALILHIDRSYKQAMTQLEEAEAKKLEARIEAEKAGSDELELGDSVEVEQQIKEKQEKKQPGAVLVFLTGWSDIDRCMKLLQNDLEKDRFTVLPLHGQITVEQQQEVFQPVADGVRKIVLSTNLAEASITVPDVEFVIDCGRAKETSYDPYLKIGTLTTSWVSKASVKQRAGRAGRTKGGLCFHLFSQARFQKLDDHTPPELLRSPMEETCLSTKLLMLETGRNDTVEEFLNKAPTKPEPMTMKNAMEDLRLMGAFGQNDQLTHLGEKLCHSSLPPSLMKTCLWGALFGVLDDILKLSWSLAFSRDPFLINRGKDQMAEARTQAGNFKMELAEPFASDHIALLRAFAQHKKDPQNWAQQKGFNPKNFRGVDDGANKLRQDIPNINYGVTSEFANRNAGNEALLISVLAAGLYPNLAVKRLGKGTRNMEVKGGKIEAMLHGTSAYGRSRECGGGTKDEEWVVFHELSQMESNYHLKSVSYLPNLVVLLMCGDEDIKEQEPTLLNEWIKFSYRGGVGYNIKDIRKGLRNSFKDFCGKDLAQPSQEQLDFINEVCSLLSKCIGSSFTAKKRLRDDGPGWSQEPQARRFKGGGKYGGRDNYNDRNDNYNAFNNRGQSNRIEIPKGGGKKGNKGDRGGGNRHGDRGGGNRFGGGGVGGNRHGGGGGGHWRR